MAFTEYHVTPRQFYEMDVYEKAMIIAMIDKRCDEEKSLHAELKSKSKK